MTTASWVLHPRCTVQGFHACEAHRLLAFARVAALAADWLLHGGVPFDRVNVAPVEERYDKLRGRAGRDGCFQEKLPPPLT